MLIDNRWTLSAYSNATHLVVSLNHKSTESLNNQVTIKLLPPSPDAPRGPDVVVRALNYSFHGCSKATWEYFLPLNSLAAYFDHDSLALSVTLPDPHGLAGLHNQGATCYISSFIQVLFHLRVFRRSILAAALEPESHDITTGLAETFYDLMTKPTASTKVLTSSFGYKASEVFVQHDLHELSRLLLDKIENDGDCSIFDLKVTTRIKCLNVDYTSER